MSDFSTYKNLELPKSNERYDIAVANKNSMLIDSELHKLDLKNQSQDNLLASKESLHSEIQRASAKENELSEIINAEILRAEKVENNLSDHIADEAHRAATSENHIRQSLSEHITDGSNPHKVTAAQLNLGNVDNTADIDKPVSILQQNAIALAISDHNVSASSHDDMRNLISELATRLNALADSDDTTLDQLSEIVAYIKNNKSLIDGVTTSKVNIADIIDNLTSTASDKPLSSNQGRILKGLIDSLTKKDIGLENVENKSSETIRREITRENITNALGYTPSAAYGVVSTSENGLCPKRDGSTSKFLRGDGTWATLPGSNGITYSTLEPASLTEGMTWVGN